MNAQDEIRASLPEDKRDMFDAWVSELADKVAELTEQRDDRALEVDDMETVLERVKYWLHDILILQKPVSPCPRTILREVEAVL